MTPSGATVAAPFIQADYFSKALLPGMPRIITDSLPSCKLIADGRD
jgi:hypothetical protein